MGARPQRTLVAVPIQAFANLRCVWASRPRMQRKFRVGAPDQMS